MHTVQAAYRLHWREAVPTDYEDMHLLAHAILEYFVSHPNAADSLEGIMQWWLAQQGLVATKSQVLEALEYLCASGAVVKTVSQSGGVIYSSAGKK